MYICSFLSFSTLLHSYSTSVPSSPNLLLCSYSLSPRTAKGCNGFLSSFSFPFLPCTSSLFFIYRSSIPYWFVFPHSCLCTRYRARLWLITYFSLPSLVRAFPTLFHFFFSTSHLLSLTCLSLSFLTLSPVTVGCN